MKAENSGKCLNVDGGAANDGTNITLWQQTDQNQWFRFFDAGNGYYIIQGHTHSGFYVLDVAAARNQDGTNVHVWHYNQGAPEQKWKLVRRNPSSQPQPQHQNNSENWDALVGRQVNINSPAYNQPLNRFSRGQCTWFAWGRMKDVTGKEITFRGSATAKLWKDNATNCVRCDLQSKCIAVRIYDSGHGNGHVAFVEHVEGNNVYYSQDNWTSDKNRKFLKTTVAEFKRLYQYFIK